MNVQQACDRLSDERKRRQSINTQKRENPRWDGIFLSLARHSCLTETLVSHLLVFFLLFAAFWYLSISQTAMLLWLAVIRFWWQHRQWSSLLWMGFSLESVFNCFWCWPKSFASLFLLLITVISEQYWCCDCAFLFRTRLIVPIDVSLDDHLILR